MRLLGGSGLVIRQPCCSTPFETLSSLEQTRQGLHIEKVLDNAVLYVEKHLKDSHTLGFSTVLFFFLWSLKSGKNVQSEIRKMGAKVT